MIKVFSGMIFIVILLISGCSSNQSNNDQVQSDNELEASNEENVQKQDNQIINSEENIFDEQDFMNAVQLGGMIDNFPPNIADDLQRGGPPPDGIPAIDDPKFISVNDADEWLNENEPVIWIKVGDTARAYPLQVLMWHEIVNDTIEGTPVSVTFCPLCNSAFSFIRDHGDHVLDFGTSGYLYQGAMLMYDRQTHTLWGHFGGVGLAGPLKDERLEIIPSSITSWKDYKETYPNSHVLSKETGFQRNYGQNPYVGYDRADEPPFLFSGEIDGRFAPKERIVAIEVDNQTKAYLTETLKENRVINDKIKGQSVTLFYQEGTASGLDDSSIAAGKDVGSTNVFFSDVKGETLDFHMDNDVIKDEQTNSTWNFFGEATAGEYEGQSLLAVPFKLDTFWFAWAAYDQETLIYNVDE